MRCSSNLFQAKRLLESVKKFLFCPFPETSWKYDLCWPRGHQQLTSLRSPALGEASRRRNKGFGGTTCCLEFSKKITSLTCRSSACSPSIKGLSSMTHSIVSQNSDVYMYSYLQYIWWLIHWTSVVRSVRRSSKDVRQRLSLDLRRVRATFDVKSSIRPGIRQSSRSQRSGRTRYRKSQVQCCAEDFVYGHRFLSRYWCRYSYSTRTHKRTRYWYRYPACPFIALSPLSSHCSGTIQYCCFLTSSGRTDLPLNKFNVANIEWVLSRRSSAYHCYHY